MDIGTRPIVAFLVAVAAVSAVAFGQGKSDEPVKTTSCADIHRTGRRIVSKFDIVEFYVPLFAHTKKCADVDYVEYYVRYGPEQDKLWLKFMFGVHVGGASPNDLQNTSIKWTAQKWSCGNFGDGKDWRGSGDGLRWRHVSIPFGFAAYENAPPKAARYFDKILDMMCCGKCPVCKK
jgi:hypothetical protein